MKLKNAPTIPSTVAVSENAPASPLSTRLDKTMTVDSIRKAMKPLGNSPLMNDVKESKGSKARKVEKEKRKRQKEKEVEKREIAKKKKVAKQQENTFEYPKTKMPPSSLVEEVRNGKRGGARDYKGELTRGAERGRRGSRSHTH